MSGAPATKYLTKSGVQSVAPTDYVGIPTTLGQPTSSSTYGYKSNVGRGLGILSPYTLSISNTYLQGQNATKDLLCGMYSLNHILQGEYFVYRPGEALRIEDGPISKINLWVICDTNPGLCIPADAGSGPELIGQFELGLFSRIAEELNLRVENVDYQNTFTMDYQSKLASRVIDNPDAYFDSLESEQAEILTVGSTYPPRPPARVGKGKETDVEKLYRIWGLMMGASQTKLESLSNDRGILLNPDELPISLYKTDSYSIMAKLNVELDKPDLLGVVFGSSNHWIALVKYSNLCLTEDEPRYTIIDSLNVKLGQRVPQCLTKNELLLAVAKYSDEATWGQGDGINESGRPIRIRVSVGKASFIYATDATPPTIEAVRRMHLSPKIQEQKGRLRNSGYSKANLVKILTHNIRAIENTNANINARTAGRVAAIVPVAAPAAPASASRVGPAIRAARASRSAAPAASASRVSIAKGLIPTVNPYASMTIKQLMALDLTKLKPEQMNQYIATLDNAAINPFAYMTLEELMEVDIEKLTPEQRNIYMPALEKASKLKDSWKCGKCTFDNPSKAKKCQVCGAKPKAGGRRITRRVKKQRRRSTLRQ